MVMETGLDLAVIMTGRGAANQVQARRKTVRNRAKTVRHPITYTTV